MMLIMIIFCVADLHAITINKILKELRNNNETVATFIASGIDPKKV